MKKCFVGWDVGAWNCDKGSSRDALCVLTGTSLDDLTFAAAPYRRNIRAEIVGGSSPLAILPPQIAKAPIEEAVIAIDTPLGWPQPFSNLLTGKGDLIAVPEESDLNPYIFRLTELRLFKSGGRPLSAVRDMIGSQSTKGLYFLKKCGFTLKSPGIWSAKNWTALETYPTPCRTSSILGGAFDRLHMVKDFQLKTQVGANAKQDYEDALWCALVAASWSLQRDSLLAPLVENARIIENEGWIWIPSDCNPDEAEGEREND